MSVGSWCKAQADSDYTLSYIKESKGAGQVVRGDYLPSAHEALGFILSTEKNLSVKNVKINIIFSS